jgi:dipeptidyl aminopeptidase/acylaminoacyl peptidase
MAESGVPGGKEPGVATPGHPSPLIAREILFGNPEKTAPQISPDAQWLAYLAPDAGVLNIWVRTLDGKHDRAVTEDRKRGIRHYRWQADSQHILYVQDKDGDEDWHVYQTNVETRVTHDLTPHDAIQAHVVVHDHRMPDTLLLAMNLRDRRLHDVYRVDLRTRRAVLDTENPGDVVGWTADNALSIRAATAMAPDGGTIVRVRDNAEAPWRELLRIGPDETSYGVAGFSPDDRALWVTSSIDANAARLVEIDVESGSTTVIAEDPQYDVSGTIVHPVTRHLQAVQFVRVRTEWTIIDTSLVADFQALHFLGPGDISLTSRDLNDSTWIVSMMSDDGPVRFYAYHRAGAAATLLFTDRPLLDQHKLAPMLPVSFAARDDLELHGYLTLPVGVEPAGLPMILNVHGGPWARDVWGLDNEVQWLANRGYAVLQVNFRGSTGYGKAFINAGDRQWGAKMLDDLVDAKNWAVAQGYAHPDKVGIYGGSYGGYAVLAALAFTPGEFACGVDIVGPSNLLTLITSIPPYWAPMRALFDKRVGNVDTEQEFLLSRSPLGKADAIRTPLLIAQGANDPRVKQTESDQIVAAMRSKGKPVEYLVFPDEGHGFARPENRLKFYAAAEHFLAKYLGGRAQEPEPHEDWASLSRDGDGVEG